MNKKVGQWFQKEIEIFVIACTLFVSLATFLMSVFCFNLNVDKGILAAVVAFAIAILVGTIWVLKFSNSNDDPDDSRYNGHPSDPGDSDGASWEFLGPSGPYNTYIGVAGMAANLLPIEEDDGETAEGDAPLLTTDYDYEEK